jgi:hypothetical protein
VVSLIKMVEAYMKIMETALLLIKGVSKYEIMCVLGLGAYIKKAEKIKNLLENEK